jgi:uncharacterized protein (DUF2147 family)
MRLVKLLGPMRALLLAALSLSSLSAAARAAAPTWSTPVGLWSPIDRATGKPVGLIAIYEDHGLYYGRIEPSSAHDDRAARCTECTGSRHDQPMIGLVLMRHLRYHQGRYVGGDILDPRNGHVFDCELRLIDGGRKLIVRGYLGIPLLGRSLTWQRMQGTPGVHVSPVSGS